MCIRDRDMGFGVLPEDGTEYVLPRTEMHVGREDTILDYTKTLKGAQKHYLLSFAPVRVKPHYGIDTAIEECMPVIASTLGGVWK